MIVALAALCLLRAAVAQNLILNGGFEMPGLPAIEPIHYLADGSGFLPGWTVIDDGIGEKPFLAQGPYSEVIVAGNYGLMLNQGSGVRTTFRADVGSFYELAFSLRPGNCKLCVSPAPLRVTISGNSTSIPLVSGWTRRTIQFFATNSVNTLEFLNPSSPSDFKQFGLDEISVTKLPGVTLGVRFYPGVIVEGFIGQKYQIQAAPDLNSPVWVTLTNIFLTNSPYIFIDADPARPLDYPPSKRIYRALQVP